jgi:hypothetical protein
VEARKSAVEHYGVEMSAASRGQAERGKHLMVKKNDAIIKQWIEDLLDEDLPIRFNADYGLFVDEDGSMQGDAALFLVYRHAKIDKENDFVDYYYSLSKKISEDAEIQDLSSNWVHAITDIALEDAVELCHGLPEHLAKDHNYEALEPEMFVKVLKHYIKYGVVDWNP